MKRAKNRRQRTITILFCAGLSILLLGMIACSQILKQSDSEKVEGQNEFQLSYNITQRKRDKKDIEYIVIHDTNNKDAGADAKSNYHYFNTGDRRSSADYFVDENGVLQVNDFYRYYTWHCGDGSGKNKITNQNSIGIEICVNKDGNYKKAVEHTVELTKELMQELSIDKDHVVRHFDASGKECPMSMSDKDWKKWSEFKKKLG